MCELRDPQNPGKQYRTSGTGQLALRALATALRPREFPWQRVPHPPHRDPGIRARGGLLPDWYFAFTRRSSDQHATHNSSRVRPHR
eukprot:5027329-Prymnesium_polylepis.1